MTENKGDLISREALKKSFEDTVCIEPMPYAFVKQIIDNAPTVNPEMPIFSEVWYQERPKGEWQSIKKIDDDAEYGEIDAVQCSICKHTEDSEYWAKTYYNFCPNCGAQMKTRTDAD